METKEIKINIPEGYEIDKENSTFECIKFKPLPKVPTYNDVAESLFKDNIYYYICENGEVHQSFDNCSIYDSNNCITEEQVNKLLALNKLINVAKYLNGNWEPDFSDIEPKCLIEIRNKDLIIDKCFFTNNGFPCFKTKELAQKAIEILGEDTIKLALSQV